MKPLYQYTNEYLSLIDELEQYDELNVEQLTLLDNTSNDFIEKAKNIGAYIKNMETEQESILSVMENMDTRASKLKKKIENLKDYLKYNMESCNINEIKSTMFDIKIKSNPCKVNILDETKVESIYLKEKVTTTIDREMIKSHLKEGIELDWAVLEKGKRIEIK